jgi:ribosomal protein L39E
LFSCRRVVGGWIKAATERRINFNPTHWREWATA